MNYQLGLSEIVTAIMIAKKFEAKKPSEYKALLTKTEKMSEIALVDYINSNCSQFFDYE